MKNLLLIRHAKSAWDFPGMDDHDRPLNDRGESLSPRIGQALLQRGVSPDIILASTAARAHATARLIASELSFPQDRILTSRDLYLAPPAVILKAVQAIDESAETALIFGHNPGMHDASNQLSNGEIINKFPTLSVARFELDINYWGEITPGCGLLLEHLYPKMLNS